MQKLKPRFAVPEEYAKVLARLYKQVQRTELWGQLNGSCFCMAGLVSRAFEDLGRKVEVLPCYAIAVRDESYFLLGYKNIVKTPRQVDGHVVCLVDENILVDFGLKNIQRYGWPDFHAAVACETSPGRLFPTELCLDQRRKIIWRNDWVNPVTEKIMMDHEPVIEMLYGQCKARLRSPVRHGRQANGPGLGA